jgi:hypothetical protein
VAESPATKATDWRSALGFLLRALAVLILGAEVTLLAGLIIVLAVGGPNTIVSAIAQKVIAGLPTPASPDEFTQGLRRYVITIAAVHMVALLIAWLAWHWQRRLGNRS